MFFIHFFLKTLQGICWMMIMLILIVTPIELLFIEPRFCDKVSSGKCYGVLEGNCYATYTNASLSDDNYLCEHCYRRLKDKKPGKNFYSILHEGKRYWFQLNKWERKICDRIVFDSKNKKLFCYANNILLYELPNIDISNKFKWVKHFCMIFKCF